MSMRWIRGRDPAQGKEHATESGHCLLRRRGEELTRWSTVQIVVGHFGRTDHPLRFAASTE
jgi:hypothetical protein